MRYTSEQFTIAPAVFKVFQWCHGPALWNTPTNDVVVRSHPELLQQVDVVLRLLDEVANSLHPLFFIVGTKSEQVRYPGVRHSPGIEGEDFERGRIW